LTTTNEKFFRLPGSRSRGMSSRDDKVARIAKRPRWLLGMLAILFCLSSGITATHKPSPADEKRATAGEVADKQADLDSLRTQIDTLRKEMAAAESSRRDASDDLADTERAISSTQRELLLLTRQGGKLQATLGDLARQSDELERQLKGQQARLGKLLYRQYVRGNPDPLRLFLNGDDTSQVARDLHYLETIGRARREILLAIESSMQRQRALTEETRQQAQQLVDLEAKRKIQHERLLVQRQQRQAMLETFSYRIATQRHEIGNLQRDEKRMTALIDRLSKIIAAKALEAREIARREERVRDAERRTVEKQAAQRQASARQENRSTKPDRSPKGSVAPPERPLVAESESRQEGAAAIPPTGIGLSRLKGALHPPTRGVLVGRFGAARQEGSVWRGLFIRAGSGSEVKSIAGGRVVFAEWMRGFGNLLIVDHGESYLSVYANNESLLKQVGDEVRSGEPIAVVGNSGGNPESGLYFELRHQGRPIDPSGWVSLK